MFRGDSQTKMSIHTIVSRTGLPSGDLIGRKQWFATALPFLAWTAVAAAMVRAWQRDPYNPSLKGTESYFHNPAGALGTGILFISIDVLVLYAVLRPWSYHLSWRRALGALLLFTPWAVLNTFSLVHAGSVWATHVMAVLAIWLGLALLLAVSGVATLVERRYAREAATAR